MRSSAGSIAIASSATSVGATTASFSAWDGGELAITSARAWPPGARIEGVIDAIAPADPAHPEAPAGHATHVARVLRMKVHRCRKQGEEFLIVGRPLDLRRETRQALDDLAAATPSGTLIARW